MQPYREAAMVPLPAGDAGVSVTLASLRQLVAQAQTSELAHAAVQAALRDVPAKDGPAEVAALLAWVQAHVRYTNDPVNVELVRDPRYLLRAIDRDGWTAGDCDDMAGLLAALLETAGYPTSFLVQAGPDDSFSHILVEADIDGAWVPLDPSNRTAAPGWRPLAGVDREAVERRGGMLGQEFGPEEYGSTSVDLSNWGAVIPETSQVVSASPAPSGGSGVGDFFASLFSPASVQTALSVAERYGLARPIAGYDAAGRPIYSSSVLPLSGVSAGYSALTQAGWLGIPVAGWILIGGGLLILPRMFGGRRRRN